MSDVSEFLQSYSVTLRREIAGADMPPELTEWFNFDSCVKHQDGREVYFVTQRQNGQRAVLRITGSSTGENAAAEGTVLAKLNHPAIPKSFGAWMYKGRGYLVREYFNGEDLHMYIRKHGTLSREMLIDVILRLCDVLCYIHSQNPAVIHRDIKPENIIISGKDYVRLIDFGIARDFRQESEQDTQIAGTRPYMAPEQFGSEQTDNRADIYSLGVVMIYLATGKTDKKNLKTAYPHKELVPVIEKCIKKDREQRFRTAMRLKKRILRIQRKTTRKILMCFTAIILCAAIAASVCATYNISYKRGYGIGHEQGFDEGADSIDIDSIYNAAFSEGLNQGLEQGFEDGVDSIMDIPPERTLPFTQDELNEPIYFDSWYLEAAVRNALNYDFETQLYRRDMSAHLSDIRIYGTQIIHPSLDDIVLIKNHIDKDVVAYSLSGLGRIDARGDISSLEEIPNAYYLRTLILTSQAISDLSPLSVMKLERINISDNFVGNLLPLKDMVTLRELDVCQNPLRDLTPISRLLSLVALDISHTQVTDLSPLADLTKLQTLNMVYCDVADISVLAGLPNLREVDLSNTLVTDLSPLAKPGNPVSVRCAGLADEVVDAARSMTGIVIIDY